LIDLVLYKLGQTPDDPVAWATFAGGALSEAGRVANVAALSAIADRFEANTRIVAILPGEQVAMRPIPTPPKLQSKLLAAAAFILEDELAEPIEDMHIVVSDGFPRAACAISKAHLWRWLRAFDEAGVALTEATVDYACIGGSATACVFAGDHGRVLAAYAGRGFAVDRDLANIVAPTFIEAAGDATMIAYGVHDLVGGWASAPIERRQLPHEADLLALYGAQLASKGNPVNFLHGAFRRKSQFTFKLGGLRRPAGLAAALAAVAIVSAAAAGLRDGRIAATYEASARSLHKSAFPTYAGDDIRAHSRQILAEGAKAASFLDMSARLTASLEGQDGVAIDRVRYDSARGQYVFSIRSNSDAGIEAFRSALAAEGLTGADSGGYRRAGEAWIGEMSASVK
jgi:type II secretion system protein L